MMNKELFWGTGRGLLYCPQYYQILVFFATDICNFVEYFIGTYTAFLDLPLCAHLTLMIRNVWSPTLYLTWIWSGRDFLYFKYFKTIHFSSICNCFEIVEIVSSKCFKIINIVVSQKNNNIFYMDFAFWPFEKKRNGVPLLCYERDVCFFACLIAACIESHPICVWLDSTNFVSIIWIVRCQHTVSSNPAARYW